MARSEHGTRHAQTARREIQAISARESDEQDVTALFANTICERSDQIGARRPHVMTDDDNTGPTILRCNAEYPHERRAHIVGQIGIELVRNDPTNVVGLDDVVESSHRSSLPRQDAVAALENAKMPSSGNFDGSLRRPERSVELRGVPRPRSLAYGVG